MNITTSSGTVPFTTFPGTTWLKVLPVSGTAPSALTVTADPTGLVASPTPYQGTLTIFGGSGTGRVDVPVTLTVGALSVSPASLTFSYQAGSNLPASQTLTLSSAQGTVVSAAAATVSGGSWLLVSPASTTSPGTLSVSLNQAALPGPGTYNGSVTVTPVSGAAVTVPVSLTVTGAPPVTVSPTAVSLGFQIGGSNNAAQQSITLSTTGTQGVAFGLATNVDPNPSGRVWFNVSSAGGTIPANGNTQLTISYDPTANLPAGTYAGRIILSTPGGVPAQQTIPVTLLVSTAPLLNVSPGSLTFNYQVGTPSPAAQNVTVSSTSGQLPLTISATTSTGANWLSTPTSGVSGTPFAVTTNPTGLAPGTYNGNITVAGSGAANGPLQIPVTLVVANNPVIVISANGCNTTVNQSCSLLFGAQIGQAAPQAQALRIASSTGAQLNFSVAASASSCGGNWLLPGGSTSASGTTDTTLQILVQTGSIAAGSKCEGNLVITATNAATGAAAPNSPFNVPVTFYVSNTPLVLPSQTALTLTAPVGGAAVSQTITLNSTNPSANPADQPTYTTFFNTNNGGNWLLVSPQGGAVVPGSNVITVAALPGLLSAGTYTGSLAITASGPGGATVADSPITIPVTFQVSAGTAVVSPASLTFSQGAGGSAPAAQNISVTSSAQQFTYSVSAQVQTTSGGVQWITATPASGSTPGSVSVSVNGSTLPAGSYNGTVTVTPVGGSPTTVPVTLNVTAGTVSASPTSLTFAQAAGGAQPATQTISITGTPGAIAFTVATSTDNGGSAWLSATPTSGSTPGTVTVAVNGANLALGTYTGKVTITAAGAAGSPITIPVTLNVVTGQTLSASPGSVSFSAVVGAANAPAQTVALSATGGAAPFTAVAATSSGGNWLSVTPASGNTPASLSISANSQNLSAGTYNGTVTITSPNSVSPVTVGVTLVVSTIPKPVVGAVANAASYIAGGVSPGENVVIFGTGIGPATLVGGTLTSSGAFSTTAGNTQVLFDGTPAPVLYASAGQTSVMVPYGIVGRSSVIIRVSYQGVLSDPLSYNVVQAAPAVYTLNQQGSGPGAILNQDFSVNGLNRPAAKGSVVAIYMTGEGATDGIPADGAIAPTNGTGLFHPRLPINAFVAGMPARVEYAGSAPGIVYGVMQLNITIPANAPSGAQPLVITLGSAATTLFTSQGSVTVQVQ